MGNLLLEHRDRVHGTETVFGGRANAVLDSEDDIDGMSPLVATVRATS